MNNYCAFSNNHKCLKWTDYQVTRYELEEADEFFHQLQEELSYMKNRVSLLEDLLKDNGIPFPESENDR